MMDSDEDKKTLILTEEELAEYNHLLNFMIFKFPEFEGLRSGLKQIRDPTSYHELYGDYMHIRFVQKKEYISFSPRDPLPKGFIVSSTRYPLPAAEIIEQILLKVFDTVKILPDFEEHYKISIKLSKVTNLYKELDRKAFCIECNELMTLGDYERVAFYITGPTLSSQNKLDDLHLIAKSEGKLKSFVDAIVKSIIPIYRWNNTNVNFYNYVSHLVLDLLESKELNNMEQDKYRKLLFECSILGGELCQKLTDSTFNKLAGLGQGLLFKFKNINANVESVRKIATEVEDYITANKVQLSPELYLLLKGYQRMENKKFCWNEYQCIKAFLKMTEMLSVAKINVNTNATNTTTIAEILILSFLPPPSDHHVNTMTNNNNDANRTNDDEMKISSAQLD